MNTKQIEAMHLRAGMTLILDDQTHVIVGVKRLDRGVKVFAQYLQKYFRADTKVTIQA